MNKESKPKYIKFRNLAIILVIIIFFLGWSLINSYSNIEIFQNENSSLKDDNSELQSGIDSQLEKNDSLQNQVDELKEELSDLNRESYYRSTSEMSQSVGGVCGSAPAIENFLKDYEAWSNCVTLHYQ